MDAFALMVLLTLAQADPLAAVRRFAKPIASTEWSGAAEAPAGIGWRAEIASREEQGERLVVSGRVFQPDGRTPAAGVLVYVYHTDARGHYSRGGEGGNGRRHGRLRGWMLTDLDGRYEFRTVRPGGYPGRTDPAHIHVTLTAAGFPEHWVDEYWFEADPRVGAAAKERGQRLGRFSPVLRLARGPDGVWHGERDLCLERPSRQNGGLGGG